LAISARGDLSGRIWRAAIRVASKGRKMKISMVFGTTDPTYRTLGVNGLTVRDNCGRMIFRLRDTSSSQAALNVSGAEMLGRGQFIAQLEGSPVKGVAFHPEDEQIRQFLSERRVAALPAPEWLQLEKGKATSIWSAEIIDLARKIEGLWLQKASKRRMADAAGGAYAGAFAMKIDAAIGYLRATTTPMVGSVEAKEEVVVADSSSSSTGSTEEGGS
jgi:hypothetical protein